MKHRLITLGLLALPILAAIASAAPFIKYGPVK
jgi:hypothetical protein